MAEAFAYHERDIREHPELYGDVLRERILAGRPGDGRRVHPGAAPARPAVQRGGRGVAPMSTCSPHPPPRRRPRRSRAPRTRNSAFPRSNMAPFNLTGLPTLALPCGFAPRGCRCRCSSPDGHLRRRPSCASGMPMSRQRCGIPADHRCERPLACGPALRQAPVRAPADRYGFWQWLTEPRQQTPVCYHIHRGTERKWLHLIPSLRIRPRSVWGLICSKRAAPCGPSTRPWVAARAASMCCFITACSGTGVEAVGGATGVARVRSPRQCANIWSHTERFDNFHALTFAQDDSAVDDGGEFPDVPRPGIRDEQCHVVRRGRLWREAKAGGSAAGEVFCQGGNVFRVLAQRR